MTEYFITGGNSGLAKELISIISKKERIQYFARSENNELNNNAIFNELDLSKIINDFELDIKLSFAKGEVVFINNAAIIGEINKFSFLKTKNILNVYYINFINPMLMIKKLLQLTEKHGLKLIVVNITSGLSDYPTSYLSNYIVSKKIMKDFLNAISVEFDKTEIDFLSIDPGMINTNMQKQLRESILPSADFFASKHRENSLKDTYQTASAIYSFLKLKKWNRKRIYHINEIEELI